MASKKKAQKPKVQPQKQKVIRYKPNINLLKNMNVVLLVAGFVASLFTVFVLSAGDRHDTRSRGQEVISTPTPICQDESCLSPTPSAK